MENHSHLRAVLAMVLQALDRDAAEGRAVRGEMAEELRAAMAAQSAPAGEREAVEVVGWRHSATGSVTEDAVRASTWISECVSPLMTVAQHERILATWQRTQASGVPDALREAVEYLDDNRFNQIGAGSILHRAMRDALAAPAQPAVHPDDAAVDRFAAAMKAKLAKARKKGRGGWDDPAQCSVEALAQLLVDHLSKGNAGTFEDVANFAMMLHQRGADPQVLADAYEAPIKQVRSEALDLGVRALAARQNQGEVQRLREALEEVRSYITSQFLIDRIDAALAASTGQEVGK